MKWEKNCCSKNEGGSWNEGGGGSNEKKIVQNVENRIASMYNASNCQLLDDSHIMTLHTVTLFSTSLLVRTIHRS